MLLTQVGVALDTELQRMMATSPTFTVPLVLNAARGELLAAKSADILVVGSGLPTLLHKLFFDVRGDDTGAGGEEGRDPALVKKKVRLSPTSGAVCVGYPPLRCCSRGWGGRSPPSHI